MESGFKEFFKAFTQLKLSDLLLIYKISQIKSYKAGELLIKEGEYTDYAYGIVKGIIRTYVLKTDGEERTVRIAVEKDFAGSANCLFTDQPSFEYIEVVEDCIVIRVNTTKLKDMAKDNIRLLSFWNNAVRDALVDAVHRIMFFVALTPEERYRNLLEEAPHLILRVPQKHLASYIGITTVSLSRIKHRLTK